MQLIDEDEESSGIPLRDYVEEILEQEEINCPLEELEILNIYVDSTERFEHIQLFFGLEGNLIVIITDKEKILGYHLLDLNKQYRINDD